MDKENCKKTAYRHFNSSDGSRFNCCESTLLALSEYIGKDSDIIPEIATPFGGGIGGCGMVCGCMTGAAMAVGLVKGRSTPEGGKDEANEAVRKIAALFRQKYGSVNCSDLTGYTFCDDEITEEEKNRLHDEVCNRILSDVIEWSCEIL